MKIHELETALFDARLNGATNDSDVELFIQGIRNICPKCKARDQWICCNCGQHLIDSGKTRLKEESKVEASEYKITYEYKLLEDTVLRTNVVYFSNEDMAIKCYLELKSDSSNARYVKPESVELWRIAYWNRLLPTVGPRPLRASEI